MKKLLEFFTDKTLYISLASLGVCLIAVFSAVIVIHNNNKKLETALNALTDTETVTESVGETEPPAESSTEQLTETESQSESLTANSTKAPAASTTEPAGDRSIQYLAEYEKLTSKYEKERKALVDKTVYEVLPTKHPPLIAVPADKNDPNYEKAMEELSRVNAEVSEYNVSVEAHNKESKEQAEKYAKQLDELDKQYQKDLE
ncbi:MAG: hypothetical protein J1F37_07945, partial [Oscillospiraceae bacterium]|nr:hypothetical protein [Oscillospiraceae bacterium]